jgi:predicted nucleic acid-binding protein
MAVEVHGSLGVLLWGAATGHVDLPAAEAALERLRESSLWVSPRVLSEARHALLDLFA